MPPSTCGGGGARRGCHSADRRHPHGARDARFPRSGGARSAWRRWWRCTSAANWTRRWRRGAGIDRREQPRPDHVRGDARNLAAAGGAYAGGCAAGERERHPFGRATSRGCAAAGYQAFLVGEHLMKAGDPAAALRACWRHDPENLRHHQPGGCGCRGGGRGQRPGLQFLRAQPALHCAGAGGGDSHRRGRAAGGRVRERGAGAGGRDGARGGLDVVQLHGDEAPEDYPAGRCGKRCGWARGSIGRAVTGELSRPEALVLDGPAGELYGGAGRTFDWTLAGGCGQRIVLAGGLDAANVARAIELARPWGVDACSRIESAPGKKDHQKMSEFLRAARAALRGMTAQPDPGGHFGPYGGRYVPEVLMAPIEELEQRLRGSARRTRHSRRS